jgi:hypothetical protein
MVRLKFKDGGSNSKRTSAGEGSNESKVVGKMMTLELR